MAKNKKSSEYEKELKLSRAGRINTITNQIQLNPENHQNYYRRACVLIEIGKLSHAIADLDYYILHYPSNVSALIQRGNAHFELGNFEKAVSDYKKIFELSSNIGINKDILEHEMASKIALRAGDLLRLEGKFDDAINLYSYAIIFHSVEAYQKRAAMYHILEQFDLAIVDYNKYLGINRNNINIQVYRGIAYRKIGDFKNALVDFNKALKKRSDLIIVYYQRALLYTEIGNDVLALRNFELYLKYGGYNTYGDPDNLREKLATIFPDAATNYGYLEKGSIGTYNDRELTTKQNTSSNLADNLKKSLLKNCRHKIHPEECPICASWGSGYEIRWDD